MAFSPPKPPRTRKLETSQSSGAFREARNICNDNNSNGNSNSKDPPHRTHLSPHDEVREQPSLNFVIPPPSRKYTTTNPGTLSPIYHLVYDLTAPTTSATSPTTPTATTTTIPNRHNLVSSVVGVGNHFSSNAIPSPHSPLSPDEHRYNHHQQQQQQQQPHPGTLIGGKHEVNHSHNQDREHVNRDGLGLGLSALSSYSGLTANGDGNLSNYLADKRRMRNDLGNRDAMCTQQNNTRSSGEGFLSPVGYDPDNERSNNCSHPSFSPSSNIPDSSVNGPRKVNHINEHLGVWSGDTMNGNDTRVPLSHQNNNNNNNNNNCQIDRRQDLAVLSHSQVSKDIFESRTGAVHTAYNGYDINSSLLERGGNSSLNKNQDNGDGQGEQSSENRLNVKQAIDIWRSRVEGDFGINSESNQVPAYQHGESSLDVKRAVFQREGDGVRLVLVNSDNSLGKSAQSIDNAQCNGDSVQRITDTGDDNKFNRGEKLNLSQRWLNKLGLLGKGNRKKDNNNNNNGKFSNSKSILSSNDEHSRKEKEKDKTSEDSQRPQVSKKPLNRWDSIHVNTKQAIASATGLEKQTARQTKEVSFAQTVTSPNQSGQSLNVAGMTPDVPSRPGSNLRSCDLVTESNASDGISVSVGGGGGGSGGRDKPAIKGILVNKGKGFHSSSNACQKSANGQQQYSHQQQQQSKHTGGVQFQDDTAIGIPHFSHSKPLLSSSSLSPSLVSSQSRREVIDRSKYIIKQYDHSNRLNQSHDSALAVEADPVLRLDNLIGVIGSQTHGVNQNKTMPGPHNPSIINYTRRNSEGQQPSSSLSHFKGLGDSGETWTTSDSTRGLSSVPGTGGSGSKHGPGGSIHTSHSSYNHPAPPPPPRHGAGLSENSHHHKIKIKDNMTEEESMFSTPPEIPSRIPKLNSNYHHHDRHNNNNNNNYNNNSGEITQTSRGNFRESNHDHLKRYPGFPVANQPPVTSFTVSQREERDGKAVNEWRFANHSAMNHLDAKTVTAKEDNKQVDGEDTLRYRRTLREIGKKNQNLYHVDPSSQWIKQRIEDLNSGLSKIDGLFTSPQRDADTRSMGAEFKKPQPNPKPKITPRQKFEITHNRVSGKVASNLRHTQDKLDPPPLISPSGQRNYYVLKANLPGHLDLAGSVYKESPRAKFERDRAARTSHMNNIHSNTNLANDSSFNVPCPERLNKSCDDLETDSDGYLTPSTYHKSRSTETLLSHSEPLSPLVPISSKLSPRARFESSRIHGNHRAHKSSSLDPLRRDNCEAVELRDSSWTNSISDLRHNKSLSKLVQGSPLNSNSGQQEQSFLTPRNSNHQAFPYFNEQRNQLISATQVRSLQSSSEAGRRESERRENERREENEIVGKEGHLQGGAGSYGTSVVEKFLSKQHAAHLSSTANNIDTSASRWSSGTGDDVEGIKNASEERRTKQLNNSRAVGRIHTSEHDDEDAPSSLPIIIKPVLAGDSQNSDHNARFPEGNSTISSANFASSSSDKSSSFVISTTPHPLGDSGGPLKESNSADFGTGTQVNAIHHGSVKAFSVSDPPRPAQVLAVKKMSPDSVSSSGYESEHTSSAVFHKSSSRNEKHFSCVEDNRNHFNNNSNLKNNNNVNNNNNKDSNSLERKIQGGVSTVQELRLRFGYHNNQQQQQQQNNSVDARINRWNNNYSNGSQSHQTHHQPQEHFNGQGHFHGSEHHSNDHVLLSDDRYDDSLSPRSPCGGTRAVSSKRVPLSPRADVNNNNNHNNNSGGGGASTLLTESDTGVRYDYNNSKDNHFSGDSSYNNNSNRHNFFGCDNGFSDSQLLNSCRKRINNNNNVNVNSTQDINLISPTQSFSPRERASPKEKKQHTKLEKVSRSMHEIIHDLKLDSGDPQTPSRRHRRSRRCSKCQDNSSPNFCTFCKHIVLDSSRDSVDIEGVLPQSPKFKEAVVPSKTSAVKTHPNFINIPANFVPKQNRVGQSISEVAAMLASKGLRIYEDTGEYVPMKSPLKSPTISSLTGHPLNLEAARYLIVPTILESFTNSGDSNSIKPQSGNQNLSSGNAANSESTNIRSQRQLALEALAQRSISDSGATIIKPVLSFAPDDDINNGAHSDGDICDEDAYLSMDLANSRPKAMSMDMLCSDGAVPDAEDSTDAESTAPQQKVTTRLRRKDRRSSKGYVEWRTCSGWVGKTDMRLSDGRNSRGYIEWDTIWATATPCKTEKVDDEHVYDVIQDESASQTQEEPQSQSQTQTQSAQPEVATQPATTTTIDTPPALPERTYINRLKNVNSSPVQSSRRHSPHHHHGHHHHHHHHHHHSSNNGDGGHHHSHHHHHHHSSRHHQHQSHGHNSGRRSHGHHHHHSRSSPQSSSSTSAATPKLKSASKKPPPPAPPVETASETPPSTDDTTQNYAQVIKLKGYTFSDALTSPSASSVHQSTDKSVIYSENYWHLGPVTSEERLSSWQSGDVLDYIDGLHDSMSPKRRENIYILLNNKKTRAKFSESLEIESRLLSKGLLCSPGNKKDGESKPEDMDTTPTINSSSPNTPDQNLLLVTTLPSTTSGQSSNVARSHKVRTSVSSTYV